MHSEFAAGQHQAAEFAGRSILGGVAAGQPVCREGWLILANSKKIRPPVGKVALAENNADFWGCVCYIISARKGGPNGAGSSSQIVRPVRGVLQNASHGRSCAGRAG